MELCTDRLVKYLEPTLIPIYQAVLKQLPLEETMSLDAGTDTILLETKNVSENVISGWTAFPTGEAISIDLRKKAMTIKSRSVFLIFSTIIQPTAL